MAVIERTFAAAARWRENVRYRGDSLTVGGLWALIVILVLWSALNSDTRQLFVVGIVVGSIYALGAIGLTLIYGILKFANFAHGDSMMLAAYLAFFVLSGRVLEKQRFDKEIPWSVDHLPGSLDKLADLSFGYGLIIAAVVAAAGMALLFIGLDRLIYRPLRRRGAGIVIFAVASLGVAIAMRSVILMIWGPDPRVYVEGIHKAQSYPFDIVLKTNQVFTFAVAVGLACLVYLVLYRTKLGKAMRAMSDNADLARVSGINTEQVIVWTWLIGGALVAVAGVLLAVQAQLSPQLGFGILLALFASTILGGIGNPLGALVGAMVVGIAQEVSVGGFGIEPLRDIFSPGYKPGVAFVILIVILLLRPRGLLGAKT